MKSVIEVIKDYNLELFDKEYRDIYYNDSHSINLQVLKELPVRDIKINFMTNKVIIWVLGIEKYDKKKEEE